MICLRGKLSDEKLKIGDHNPDLTLNSNTA